MADYKSWWPGTKVVNDENDPVKAQLIGSIVADVNGTQAVQTKQVALAYDSWNFSGQDLDFVVTAGSFVREDVARAVNGFGSLAFILKQRLPEAGKVHSIEVHAAWQSVSGSYNSARASSEKIFDGNTDVNFSAVGVTTTKSQYVLMEIHNKDTVDHGYFVHMLLRV